MVEIVLPLVDFSEYFRITAPHYHIQEGHTHQDISYSDTQLCRLFLFYAHYNGNQINPLAGYLGQQGLLLY